MGVLLRAKLDTILAKKATKASEDEMTKPTEMQEAFQKALQTQRRRC
jgi:hypothetical protein